MLADPSLKAIAVECDPARAARIRSNAIQFGVPGLEIVTEVAPAAFDVLPQPDAIFIGGGGTEPGVMDAALARLKPGGRIIANAVTTAMEAVLLALQARVGGTLIRLDIARMVPVGTMFAWRPAMPVTQWAWTKPIHMIEDET